MFMEQKTQPQEVLPEGKRTTPQIYIYSDNAAQPGWLKIGQTTRDVAVRMREQHNIVRPNQTERLEWQGSAFYADGSGETFTDKAIHRYLRQHGYTMKGEWCRCSLTMARNAYEAVRQRTEIEAERYLSFPMREEQRRAVEKTIAYFAQEDAKPNGRAPHFLWNAKMRFGKTFTTYQLAKRIQAKRVLVLTFKPAVEESWHDDLMQHTDFSGWQFFSSRDGGDPSSLDPERPIVCFGSFQDYLGKNDTGGIKAKNEWVHAINWDLIVLDEYHFGAWNDHAKTLLDIGREDDKQAIREQNELLHESGYDVQAGQLWDEDILPITGRHYLYLSGTPFRALNNGEFLEDQIFNWTYQDEQRAKAECTDTPNPYEELPTMVMMTYQMPADLGVQIEQYDMNEFDLNEFFRANGNGKDARFVHEKSVQKWLDIIRGKASIYTKSDDPTNTPPPLPYDDTRLLDMCNHTMWFFASVSSCDAMENLLHRPANNFYQGYTIVNCSGVQAGVGVEALRPVREAMGDNPVQTKTIILTCGKLTTGVTIKPLSGIFMLRNCSSPETYFQSAFRVQSPWTTIDPADPMRKQILKRTCYVFDFAPNRALREVVTYANQLSVSSDAKATEKVAEFIRFLPILQFDGASMHIADATQILDFVDNGTTATLLARRWNSASLVVVSNDVLERVLANPDALDAIMKIEGFRALGSDIIETIVNKAHKINDLKTKSKGNTTKEAKKELTNEEKEYRSKRREVQEKLMKFATRIPIFMYLTDYREEALTDIIRKLEPDLFERVTGLTIDDFNLLLSVGVFNDSQINDAILKFRRYEDSSLEYTGINRHKTEQYIGAFNSRVPTQPVIAKL